jgi:hypothetical protein
MSKRSGDRNYANRSWKRQNTSGSGSSGPGQSKSDTLASVTSVSVLEGNERPGVYFYKFADIIIELRRLCLLDTIIHRRYMYDVHQSETNKTQLINGACADLEEEIRSAGLRKAQMLARAFPWVIYIWGNFVIPANLRGGLTANQEVPNLIGNQFIAEEDNLSEIRILLPPHLQGAGPPLTDAERTNTLEAYVERILFSVVTVSRGNLSDEDKVGMIRSYDRGVSQTNSKLTTSLNVSTGKIEDREDKKRLVNARIKEAFDKHFGPTISTKIAHHTSRRNWCEALEQIESLGMANVAQAIDEINNYGKFSVTVTRSDHNFSQYFINMNKVFHALCLGNLYRRRRQVPADAHLLEDPVAKYAAIESNCSELDDAGVNAAGHEVLCSHTERYRMLEYGFRQSITKTQNLTLQADLDQLERDGIFTVASLHQVIARYDAKLATRTIVTAESIATRISKESGMSKSGTALAVSSGGSSGSSSSNTPSVPQGLGGRYCEKCWSKHAGDPDWYGQIFSHSTTEHVDNKRPHEYRRDRTGSAGKTIHPRGKKKGDRKVQFSAKPDIRYGSVKPDPHEANNI